jgi:hypothetical protein
LTEKTLGAITDYIANCILNAFNEDHPDLSRFYDGEQLDEFIQDHTESQESYAKEMKELLEGFKNGTIELPEALRC